MSKMTEDEFLCLLEKVYDGISGHNFESVMNMDEIIATNTNNLLKERGLSLVDDGEPTRADAAQRGADHAKLHVV